MSAIRVERVGKAYRQYQGRWDRLVEWMRPGAARRHELKWVLRDVSFSVNAGEVLAILGVNGAGKSTLLKILAGTTQATEGFAQVEGRVAALLELGMGFHPDFTGRQNALLSGSDCSDRAARHRMPSAARRLITGLLEQRHEPARTHRAALKIGEIRARSRRCCHQVVGLVPVQEIACVPHFVRERVLRPARGD